MKTRCLFGRDRSPQPSPQKKLGAHAQGKQWGTVTESRSLASAPAWANERRGREHKAFDPCPRLGYNPRSRFSRRDHPEVGFLMTDEIPAFRPDGYLPVGLHICSEAEAVARFGSQNRRRRRLVLRLRRWCELGRAIGARRLLLDGSFVTAKAEPEEVDAVMLLPAAFTYQVEQGMEAALELEEMFGKATGRDFCRGRRRRLAGVV